VNEAADSDPISLRVGAQPTMAGCARFWPSAACTS